jgi:nucleotide-binding universal stress UspA family protein
MLPSHVLVPLDGSPLAEAALQHALVVFDCKLTVLNVVTPLEAGMSEGQVLERGEERETAARDRTDAAIDRAVERTGATDRAIEVVVRTGDPAEEILASVEAHDVDQIVMGGHGGDRGALTRRLLGTVSTAVVGDAPVTVTVVRPPDREPPETGRDSGEAEGRREEPVEPEADADGGPEGQ